MRVKMLIVLSEFVFNRVYVLVELVHWTEASQKPIRETSRLI